MAAASTRSLGTGRSTSGQGIERAASEAIDPISDVQSGTAKKKLNGHTGTAQPKRTSNVSASTKSFKPTTSVSGRTTVVSLKAAPRTTSPVPSARQNVPSSRTNSALGLRRPISLTSSSSSGDLRLGAGTASTPIKKTPVSSRSSSTSPIMPNDHSTSPTKKPAQPPVTSTPKTVLPPPIQSPNKEGQRSPTSTKRSSIAISIPEDVSSEAGSDTRRTLELDRAKPMTSLVNASQTPSRHVRTTSRPYTAPSGTLEEEIERQRRSLEVVGELFREATAREALQEQIKNLQDEVAYAKRTKAMEIAKAKGAIEKLSREHAQETARLRKQLDGNESPKASELESEVRTLKKALEESKASAMSRDDRQTQALQEREARNEELVRVIAELQKEIQRVETELEADNIRKAEDRQRMAREAERLRADGQKIRQAHATELKRGQKALEQTMQEKQRLQEKVAELQQANVEALRQIGEVSAARSAEMEKLKALAASKKSALQQVNEELHLKEEAIARLSSELQTSKKHAEELQFVKTEAQKSNNVLIRDLQRQLQSVQGQNAEYRRENEQSAKAIDTLSAEIQTLKQLLEDADRTGKDVDSAETNRILESLNDELRALQESKHEAIKQRDIKIAEQKHDVDMANSELANLQKVILELEETVEETDRQRQKARSELKAFRQTHSNEFRIMKENHAVEMESFKRDLENKHQEQFLDLQTKYDALVSEAAEKEAVHDSALAEHAQSIDALKLELSVSSESAEQARIKLKETAEALASLQQAYDDLIQRREDDGKLYSQAVRMHDEAIEALKSELHTSAEAAEQARRQFETTLARAQSDIASLEERNSTLESALRAQKDDFDAKEAQLVIQRDQVTEMLSAVRADKDRYLQERNATRFELRKVEKELTDQLVDLNDQSELDMAHLRGQIAALEAEREALKNDLIAEREKQRNLVHESGEHLMGRLIASEAGKKLAEERIEAMVAGFEFVEAKMAEERQLRDSAEVELAQVKEELRRGRDEKTKLQEQIERLKEQLNTRSSSSNLADSLALLHQRQANEDAMSLGHHRQLEAEAGLAEQELSLQTVAGRDGNELHRMSLNGDDGDDNAEKRNASLEIKLKYAQEEIDLYAADNNRLIAELDRLKAQEKRKSLITSPTLLSHRRWASLSSAGDEGLGFTSGSHKMEDEDTYTSPDGLYKLSPNSTKSDSAIALPATIEGTMARLQVQLQQLEELNEELKFEMLAVRSPLPGNGGLRSLHSRNTSGAY